MFQSTYVFHYVRLKKQQNNDSNVHAINWEWYDYIVTVL